MSLGEGQTSRPESPGWTLLRATLRFNQKPSKTA